MKTLAKSKDLRELPQEADSALACRAGLLGNAVDCCAVLLQADVDLRRAVGEVPDSVAVVALEHRLPGRADRVLEGRDELALGVRLDLDQPVPGGVAPLGVQVDHDGLAAVVVVAAVP